MKITIEIDTGNAAFEDDLHGQLRNLFADALNDLRSNTNAHGGDLSPNTYKLTDTNGNRCGAVTISES